MGGIKIWHDKLGDYLEVIFEDVPATMEEVAEDMFAHGQLMNISNPTAL